MKKIKTYLSTHFAAAITLAIGGMFLAVVLILQVYLNREYLRNMTKQSYDQENAAMKSLQINMNQVIHELIREGSEMAVDESLYDMACLLEDSSQENQRLNHMLQISNRLRNYVYGSYAIVSAVTGPEGFLVQYDRYRTTNSSASMWEGERTAGIEEITAYISNGTEQDGGGQETGMFPRIRLSTENGIHPRYRENRIFHLIFPLTGGKTSVWNTRYALVMSYSFDVFQVFLDTVNIPQEDYLQGYITDREGKIIYYEDDAYFGQDVIQAAGEEVSIITGDLDYFGLQLHIVIDKVKLKNYIERLHYRAFFLCLTLLAAGTALIFLFLRHLLKPVGILSESMRQAESGNTGGRVSVEGQHEIWQVAEEYNRMLDALDEKNLQIAHKHLEMLQSLEQKHAAEREALESQINAHFICNTLGCINYEAIEAGNHEVSVLIKKLSNILRYTFDQKHQEVYISQEIAWLDQYLFLQKLRYEDLFHYEISFPEPYGQWPCCKLMFQPFVENSILHGFEGRADGGMIRITGDMDGELLHIVIEDNGSGMDTATEEAIQSILMNKGAGSLERSKRVGIGIKNVVTRMRMFYGERFEVRMETVQGEGTSFGFWIPIPEGAGVSEEEDL